MCSFSWYPASVQKVFNILDEEQALKIIWEVLDEHHTERLLDFNQIPFRRVFMGILKQYYNVFKTADSSGNLDVIKKSNEILLMFSNLFKQMNPSVYPGFSFSWLELVSSPFFMPFMLKSSSDFDNHERWFKLQELFAALFSFFKENIYDNCTSSPALEKLFEGTLKLCLVVLHDYPEFFSMYYFELINHLPLYKTGDLRNSILAAYPKALRLPDPTVEIVKFEFASGQAEQDRQALLQYYVDEPDYYSLKTELDKYLSKLNF